MSPQQHTFKHIFKRGSKTYFNSSLFFPKDIREKVFRLYAFVRVADDFVDVIPQKRDEFFRFKEAYHQAMRGNPAQDEVIDSFVSLSKEENFDPAWTEAFLSAMEADLTKTTYYKLEETLQYTYGSAEVIGFFMARIMRLVEEAFPYAALLGRAMQYINFIRDIAEDIALGRTYLPLNESPFSDLTETTCRKNPQAFEAYIRKQISRYLEWQKEAEKGFLYLPKLMLIPIKTASDMYAWTAKRISSNPWIIYQRKVKPSRWRILLQIFINAFTIPYSSQPRYL